MFFSTFFFRGRKWAKSRTKSQKLTTSLSLASKSLWTPLEVEWPSRKKACTIRSPSGLMANSGIRRKSSRVKYPLSCLSKLVNLLHNRSIWLAVTEKNRVGKLVHMKTIVCKICQVYSIKLCLDLTIFSAKLKLIIVFWRVFFFFFIFFEFENLTNFRKWQIAHFGWMDSKLLLKLVKTQWSYLSLVLLG